MKKYLFLIFCIAFFGCAEPNIFDTDASLYQTETEFVFKKDTRILTVYNTLVQSGFSFGEYDVKGQYGDDSFTKMIIKKENYADGATWIYFYFINDEKEVARYFFTYLGSNIWFNEFLQEDLVIEK